MTDYQPTDEQIEALARDDYRRWGGLDTPHLLSFEQWVEDAKQVVAYPAFQAIIRAAQAEARATPEGDWEWGYKHSQGTVACRSKADAENRYQEGVEYDARRRFETRGRNAIVRRVPAGPWQTVLDQSESADV